MNVPYKWQARIVVGDYYLNSTNNKKNDKDISQNEEPKTEQKTHIELEVADDNVNETVLNALAMLNKVFVHDLKSEEMDINK